MKINRRIAAFGLAMSLATGMARAHEGHDDAPKPIAGATGAPRIEAHSDLFELVGIVEHGAMTVYLDRYADNAPVTNAKIEVESGQEKAMATPNPDGTYTVALKLPGGPAQLSFVFTVSAGNDADLLAGDLTIPDISAAPAHAAGLDISRTAWLAGAGAVLAALLIALALRLRRMRKGL